MHAPRPRQRLMIDVTDLIWLAAGLVIGGGIDWITRWRLARRERHGDR